MSYTVSDPKMNGNIWWKVISSEGVVVALFLQDLGQAEMWARLLCDQLNRGEK